MFNTFKPIAKIALWAACATLMSSTFAAQADSNDKPVQYLHLQNEGSYVITDIELKWVTPSGDTKSNKFTKDMRKEKGFCLDLQKFGDVPEGSEVWLKAYIGMGDNESCRKSNRRIYSPNGALQHYKMSGETATNNSCKLTAGDPDNETDYAGNASCD